MKYFFDNNLSPHLAKAVAALSEPDGHSVKHLKDMYPSNARDIDWITDLSSNGNWVVISHDRFKKNPSEKEAVRKSGLTIFELAKGWAQQTKWPHAAQFIRWWPRIIEVSESVQGGAAFEVPWNISGKGQLKQL